MGWFGPSKTEKLYKAAQDGDEAELTRLIERGGNVNWHNPDDSGRTALICASIYGREGCVRLLLEAKAIEVNAKNNYDQTALHYAAHDGYLAIAKRLLEGGADVTLRDKYGETAIDLARKQGKSEVVALLSEPRWDKAAAAKAKADKVAADKAAADKAAADKAAAAKVAAEKAAVAKAAADKAGDDRASPSRDSSVLIPLRIGRCNSSSPRWTSSRMHVTTTSSASWEAALSPTTYASSSSSARSRSMTCCARRTRHCRCSGCSP